MHHPTDRIAHTKTFVTTSCGALDGLYILLYYCRIVYILNGVIYFCNITDILLVQNVTCIYIFTVQMFFW